MVSCPQLGVRREPPQQKQLVNPKEEALRKVAGQGNLLEIQVRCFVVLQHRTALCSSVAQSPLLFLTAETDRRRGQRKLQG
jgi:hypothetical protein